MSQTIYPLQLTTIRSLNLGHYILDIWIIPKKGWNILQSQKKLMKQKKTPLVWRI